MPATAEFLIPTFQIAPGKSLLTAKQAAEYLHVREQTLNNWRQIGRGPRFVRMGRLIRYRLSELDKFVEENSQTA